ncbi:MAG: lamin tail domain-containing protein [Planctomycetes bacterium]|nr:lamin tail domain-containing protein [Planctomycetota bacterium]
MRTRHALIAVAVTGLLTGAAMAQGWPDVFDPFQLLTLNLEMDNADWQTIQNDESLSIEVPADFWADGEEPILISVRRKSADPLTEGQGYIKVSLKLDINEYVTGQDWHDLKKLSLENGDDEDVVSEGLAWQIERLASGTQGYGYSAGYTAWVRLVINGVYTGVYVNVEQRDKRFLENRGLYTEGETWLYKVSDVGQQELKVGGPEDSPTVEALCYLPFDPDETCPPPDLAEDVPLYVNMPGILTLMASDAFQANGDALLSKGKNFYFADFLDGTTRMYFPWDRDSSLSGGGVNDGVYGEDSPGQGSPYPALLDVPEFRAQYNELFNDLICGPWSVESLVAVLDAVEPVLTEALEADPNAIPDNGTVAEQFDSLRGWVADRVAVVSGALEDFEPCSSIYVTLNELMADNFSTIEDPDEPGEFPDWFEIYNPNAEEVDLGGVYITDDLANPTKYQIPSGLTIAAGEHLIFWADDDGTQGPTHTNFQLAANGEELALFDPDGVTEIDSIVFGPQIPDVSFGRYPDGLGSWDFMATPTPGATNAAHNSPPSIVDTMHTPAAPTNQDEVWVTAGVTDTDGTITDVTLTYDAGSGSVEVTMVDDGAHQDGAAGDDVYGAQIPAQPQDTLVNYYLTATDDLGAVSMDPLGAPGVTHSYVVDYLPPMLFINEFMASNTAAYEDPENPGDFDDWIEIYNGEAFDVDLGGRYMTDDLALPTKWQVPEGVSVPAGGYLIIWADDEPLQGDTHATFKLNSGGEQIGLFDTDANGNLAIDTLTFTAQTTDISEGRFPDGADCFTLFAGGTPGASNVDPIDPQDCSCETSDSDGDGVSDCDDVCPGGDDTIDEDMDGTPDDCDGCPSDPNKTDPGQCGCGVSDDDTDNDGVADCNDVCPGGDDTLDADMDGTPDACDGCPDDPNKTDPGQCGCGVSDDDSDSDGTADCNDGCPEDPNKTDPGQCGCGIADDDADNDGVADCNDLCPETPKGEPVDEEGCENQPCDGDANGDGTVDPLDAGFVLARFGCPVGTGDANCDIADQNDDGSVDPLDAGYVLARFGPCE